MIIRLRDKDVNLDDELECHYFVEYLLWLEYKCLEKNDYYDKFRDMSIEIFRKGSSHFLKDTIYTPNQDIFDNISNDGTIATSKNFGSKKNLFIYTATYNMIGSSDQSVIRIPDKIYNTIKNDFDFIVISEDHVRYPKSMFPSWLLAGTSNEINTFEKLCDYVNNLITKEYNKVVLYGESALAGATVALGNNINAVTHAIVTHGDITYDFDSSPWVQDYLMYLKHREKLISKKIYNEDMDKMIWDISATRIRHIMRTYFYKKLQINKDILDPLSVYDANKFKLDYYYSKYDTDWMPFMKCVKKHEDKFNLHEIDWKYSETQTHFLAPYIEYKVLPKYLKRVLNESIL